MRGIYLLACTLIILIACQQAEKGEQQHVQGLEGRYYGGTFRINEVDHYGNLYPPKTSLAITQRVGSIIYEGLVKFDQKDLSLIPCLAESWEIDSSGTKYSFKIRAGVRFHDDDCFF